MAGQVNGAGAVEAAKRVLLFRAISDLYYEHTKCEQEHIVQYKQVRSPTIKLKI